MFFYELGFVLADIRDLCDLNTVLVLVFNIC
jgi:hypothetical protein